MHTDPNLCPVDARNFIAYAHPSLSFDTDFDDDEPHQASSGQTAARLGLRKSQNHANFDATPNLLIKRPLKV